MLNEPITRANVEAEARAYLERSQSVTGSKSSRVTGNAFDAIVAREVDLTIRQLRSIGRSVQDSRKESRHATMTAAEYRAIAASKMSEKAFMAQVVELAKLRGWTVYHSWTSIHSPCGFPDLVLARPPRVIFWECKSERGRVSLDQRAWLDRLTACGMLAEVIRPSDWDLVEERLNA